MKQSLELQCAKNRHTRTRLVVKLAQIILELESLSHLRVREVIPSTLFISNGHCFILMSDSENFNNQI